MNVSIVNQVNKHKRNCKISVNNYGIEDLNLPYNNLEAKLIQFVEELGLVILAQLQL